MKEILSTIPETPEPSTKLQPTELGQIRHISELYDPQSSPEGYEPSKYPEIKIPRSRWAKGKERARPEIVMFKIATTATQDVKQRSVHGKKETRAKNAIRIIEWISSVEAAKRHHEANPPVPTIETVLISNS